MKTTVYILSFFVLPFLAACTVKAPELVVVGVKTKEALTFLEEYQKGKKKAAGYFNYLPGYFPHFYKTGL